MKTSILSVILVLAILSISACSNQKGNKIPQEVKTAFAKKFPNAKKISWSKENAKDWEAEFIINNKKYSANYDNDGNWKETEYEIDFSDVPENVKSSLDSNFKNYKVELSEVSKTIKRKVYEFQLQKAGNTIDVSIAPDGSVINKIERK